MSRTPRSNNGTSDHGQRCLRRAAGRYADRLSVLKRALSNLIYLFADWEKTSQLFPSDRGFNGEMRRKLVWTEEPQCWACSECGWMFNPAGAPASKSFDEMKQNFELQRDKEFTSHCLRRTPKRQERKKG